MTRAPAKLGIANVERDGGFRNPGVGFEGGRCCVTSSLRLPCSSAKAVSKYCSRFVVKTGSGTTNSHQLKPNQIKHTLLTFTQEGLEDRRDGVRVEIAGLGFDKVVITPYAEVSRCSSDRCRQHPPASNSERSFATCDDRPLILSYHAIRSSAHLDSVETADVPE